MDRQDIQPPKWALRLLRWYCKPRALEIIEGDIFELFEKRIAQGEAKMARRKFGWDVLRFFRLRYIKGINDINSLNNIAMFKNYFKISLRSLYRHKFYSFINIAGLSLGLAACLLIVLYISNELSYDKFHNDSDRIYRFANGQSGNWTPARLGIQAKMDFPEIEEIVRLSGPSSSTFKVGDMVFREPNGFAADSTFHKVFTIDFIEGNPDDALTEPNSIVLTKSLAEKYFGGSSAFGEFIQFNGRTTKVTGVIADPPKNTHFYYKYINAYPHDTWVTIGNWTANNFWTYAKLVSGASREALEEKFPEFKRKYAGDEMLKYSDYDNYDEMLANMSYVPTFSLKKMTDLHLYYPSFALGSNGDINNIYIFSGVGVFILLIACINFMNLSTARSAARSKEVGMRKVLGSLRKQLISQFLVESTIISVFAMILSLGIAALALDGFNGLANRDFILNDLLAPGTLLNLLVLVLIVGFLAGSYPAFYLSAFKPIKALKGEIKAGAGNAFLRKGLVAFQFAISIFLIISTTVVFTQLRFMSSQKLGLNAEQVLSISNSGALEGKLTAFKNTIARNPNVVSISHSDRYLSGRMNTWGYQTLEENSKNLSFVHLIASSDFFNTMDIDLVDGRYFNDEFATDSAAIIINEKAAEWLGGNPLGRLFTRGDGERLPVVGVVKDFHYSSLKSDIRPMIIRYQNKEGYVPQYEEDWFAAGFVSIKVNGNYQEVVAAVESAWNQFAPDEPFNYFFLDDSFDRLYDDERRFGRMFTVSSGLAIAIACLGLFALAAFTLERRFKEIAVRKVLGASVRNLTMLIIGDFTKLVLIGSIVAIPAGYFVMKEWLNEFAYQINVGVFVLVVPAILVAIIAWITVGYQSAKTALGNPVNALRSE